jgi:hypothetical protein
MWTVFLSPKTGILIFTQRQWTKDGPVESKIYVDPNDKDRAEAEAFAATLNP